MSSNYPEPYEISSTEFCETRKQFKTAEKDARKFSNIFIQEVKKALLSENSQKKFFEDKVLEVNSGELKGKYLVDVSEAGEYHISSNNGKKAKKDFFNLTVYKDSYNDFHASHIDRRPSECSNQIPAYSITFYKNNNVRRIILDNPSRELLMNEDGNRFSECYSDIFFGHITNSENIDEYLRQHLKSNWKSGQLIIGYIPYSEDFIEHVHQRIKLNWANGKLINGSYEFKEGQGDYHSNRNLPKSHIKKYQKLHDNIRKGKSNLHQGYIALMQLKSLSRLESSKSAQKDR